MFWFFYFLELCYYLYLVVGEDRDYEEGIVLIRCFGLKEIYVIYGVRFRSKGIEICSLVR